MNTERLIAALADEAKAVRALPPPALRTGFWALAALPLVAAGVWGIGLRSDVAAQVREPIFLVILALAVGAALAAGAAAMAAAVPGRLEAGAGRWLPAALLVAWGLSLVWLMETEGFLAAPFSWSSPACVLKVAGLGLLPAGAAFGLVRRGAPLRRLQAAGLAGAAGFALASAAVPLVCPINAGAHQFFMHFLPVPVLAAALALAGRNALTWPRR